MFEAHRFGNVRNLTTNLLQKTSDSTNESNVAIFSNFCLFMRSFNVDRTRKRQCNCTSTAHKVEWGVVVIVLFSDQKNYFFFESIKGRNQKHY